MYSFFKQNKFLLIYGILLTFLSSFGQTFLIALYLPNLQEAFNLSDSGFSFIYSGATILSAFSITWLGRFIDKINFIKFTLIVMTGLVLMLLLFSQSYFLAVLFFALYGLRLFGQGLLTHTSITAMARFFELGRGKAISIASLGHPIGEVLLPFIVVSAIYAFGWRYAVFFSALLVAVAIPIVLYLLKKNTNFSQLKKYVPVKFSKNESAHANPINIIKSKAFWVIMPSSMISACIGTGFLLFKLKMGLTFGWSATFVAVGFSAYAIGNALANLVGGILADKFSGKKMFVLYLFPAILGFISLLISTQQWAYITLIGGIGITNGFGGTVKNVALTELYGTKIIGSVRSLFITVMVFSTALGPLLFGVLLDLSFTFLEITIIALVVYVLVTINSLRILKLQANNI